MSVSLRLRHAIWLFAAIAFSQSTTLARACDIGHWIDKVLGDGRIVKLEDGSLWQVDEIDTVTSSIWLPMSDIIVCDDKLINVDDNESVGARHLR